MQEDIKIKKNKTKEISFFKNSLLALIVFAIGYLLLYFTLYITQ